MAFKGKSTIELRNAETGELEQRVEDENMVTNAVYNILNYFNRYNSGQLIGNMCQILNPLLKNCFGGIMLFENNIFEDVNSIFPPSDNLMIGKAAESYNGNDLTKGTLNTTESKDINDGKGYRFVWDFATDRGNGTIRSVCLTSYAGGSFGVLDSGVERGYYSTMIARIGYPFGIRDTHGIRDLLNINGQDAYIACYEFGVNHESELIGIGCFEENVFTTAIYNESSSKSVTFVTYKLSKLYGLKGRKDAQITSHTVSSEKNFVPSYRLRTDGEKIYSIFVKDSNNFEIIILDGKSLNIIEEKSVIVQDAKFYASYPLTVFHKGYVWINSSEAQTLEGTACHNKFYKINYDDPSDFEVIELPVVTGNWYEPQIIGDSLYFRISTGTYSGSGARYVEGKGVYPCSWTRNADSLIASNIIKPPMVLRQTRSKDIQFYLDVFAPFLSTINNLSTPVVKNETQTMKVTYEITEI